MTSVGRPPESSFNCPSCRMRRDVRGIGDPPTFMPVTLSANALLNNLRRYAAEFDGSTEERWTALDFIDWLEPSIMGTERHRATTTLTSVQAWIKRDDAA